jgi:hypothetical protein
MLACVTQTVPRTAISGSQMTMMILQQLLGSTHQLNTPLTVSLNPG